MKFRREGLTAEEANAIYAMMDHYNSKPWGGYGVGQVLMIGFRAHSQLAGINSVEVDLHICPAEFKGVAKVFPVADFNTVDFGMEERRD